MSAYPEEDEFDISQEFQHEGLEGEAASVASLDEQDSEPAVTRPAKRKISPEPAKKTAKSKSKRPRLDVDEESHTIAWAPRDVQALYLADKQAAAFPQATALESDELKIPESWLLDVSAFGKPDRSSLSVFLPKALPELTAQVAKPSKKKGAPRAIVVCSAALRAADCCRDLKTLTPKGEVAKLFSKHFKLPEHITYCTKTAFSLAAGTPDRIAKLLASTSLSIDALQYLILDVTHLDSKKKCVLDLKEAREVLLRDLLGLAAVREKLAQGRMKLVFF